MRMVGGKEEEGTENRPQDDAGKARGHQGTVNPAHTRNGHQIESAEETDGCLDGGVHSQGVSSPGIRIGEAGGSRGTCRP